MSSSKAKGFVHITTPSQSSNQEFGHVDPAWVCSGNVGPLPAYVWHPQSNATAAGQQDTTNAESQLHAGHDQRHNSHNSHSLQPAIPNGQPGRASTSTDQQPPQVRTAHGEYRCSECFLVFQKRHLLKYVVPSHCRNELTLTQHQVDISGPTSLQTSAHTSGVTSASVKSETSSAMSSQSTPQTYRSGMICFVLTRDANMQKVAANCAKGRTIWADTFARSMREAHRFRMPCVASYVHVTSHDVCLKGIDESPCRG